MNNCWCDVVGCVYPAAWVRVADITPVHEDFLCHRCLSALCAARPQQAVCYVCFEDPADMNGTDGLPAFSAEDDKEPIYIG